MSSPFDRLSEEGDAAYALAIPRTDNPHPHGSSERDRWFTQWDAKALEAARLMKANGAAVPCRA